MEVNRYWSWEIPKNLQQIVVLIDSYAATTNLNIILDDNPKSLIIVNDKILGKAKKMYPENLVIGESLTLAFEEFDISNFPSEIAKRNLKDKVVLYMSINGTRVLESLFRNKRTIISCAFNNIKAVCRWLRKQNVKEVQVVMAGDYPEEVLEDKLCAEILRSEIEETSYDWKNLSKEVTYYINNYYGNPKMRQESLPFVLDINRYNIVPTVLKNEKGFLEVRPLPL